MAGPDGAFTKLGFSGGDPNLFFGFCFLSNSGTGEEAASEKAGEFPDWLSAGDAIWKL